MAKEQPNRPPAAQAPTTLYLAGTPGANPQILAQLLDRAGLAPGTRVQPLGEGSEILEQAVTDLLADAQAHMLASYPSPAPVIAAAIASGDQPASAVEQWLNDVQPLLKAFRRARKKILLVEHAAAVAEPSELMRELNQRLHLSLYRPVNGAAPDASELDPVYALMAESALRQDFTARRTLAELEASSLPLPNATGLDVIDLSATLETYREKAEAPVRKVAPLKQENGTLLEQSNHLKQENARLLRELSQLQEKLRATPAPVANPRELDDLKEENDLLLHQLHQVQEELERYYLENQSLQQPPPQNDKLQRQLDLLQRKVTYMENSRSWKITAPMRAVIKKLTRQPAKSS